MAYNKYSAKEINDLNTTRVWRQTPITIKDETNSNVTKTNKTKTNKTKYILHATGYCDLDGRTYIALPANVNINDPEIKKKYNLM
tara:strand:- start:712 stop:966 length:255 start_codon:yes stop_codon:yes gene_type:complete